jgi:hypothetical protein
MWHGRYSVQGFGKRFHVRGSFGSVCSASVKAPALAVNNYLRPAVNTCNGRATLKHCSRAARYSGLTKKD